MEYLATVSNQTKISIVSSSIHMQTSMNVLATVSKCVSAQELVLNVMSVLVSLAIDSLMMTTHAMVQIVHIIVLEMASIILLIDINECGEEIDGCAQNCINTNGSYTCGCNTGYRLGNDGYSCYGSLDTLL